MLHALRCLALVNALKIVVVRLLENVFIVPLLSFARFVKRTSAPPYLVITQMHTSNNYIITALSTRQPRDSTKVDFFYISSFVHRYIIIIIRLPETSNVSVENL